jgi:CheY-like chemotaxis protein
MNSYSPGDYRLRALSLTYKSKAANLYYNFITSYHTLSNLSVSLVLSAMGSVLALGLNSSDSSTRGLNAVFAGMFLIFAVISKILHKKHSRSMAEFENTQTSDDNRVKALRRTVADLQVITVIRNLSSLLWIGWGFANLYLALAASEATCKGNAGSWTAAVFVLPVAVKLITKNSFIEFLFLHALSIGAIIAFEKIAPLWCLLTPFSGIYMFVFAVPVIYVVEKNEKIIFALSKSRQAELAKEILQSPVVQQVQVNAGGSGGSPQYGMRLLYHVFKRLQVPIDAVAAGVDYAKTKEDEQLGRKPDPSGRCPEDSMFYPVKKNLMYINQVMHNVLSMADLDSGNYHLKFAKFNMKAALENMAASYADHVAEKDASLVVKIANDMPEFFVGDEARIKEVIINLLSNAFRYSDKGGQVKLIASTLIDHEIGECIEIKISDSGVGMTSDARFLLFDPEGQLQVATANPNSGIGIGLLLCRKIIELHGGVIGVDSLEGVGASFFIRLPSTLKEFDQEEKEEDFVVVPVNGSTGDRPAKPSNFEKKEAKDDDDDDKEAGGGHGDKRRILLVDDSAAARAQMGRYILSWEWECQEFKSGKEALETLEILRKEHGATGNEFRYGFDVLMVDTDMKGIGGIQVMQKMREMGVKSPILALVDKDKEADFKDLALKNGANDWIEKPMLKQKLREKLEKLLLLMVRDESSYEGSRSEKTSHVHAQVKPKPAAGKPLKGRKSEADDEDED